MHTGVLVCLEKYVNICQDKIFKNMYSAIYMIGEYWVPDVAHCCTKIMTSKTPEPESLLHMPQQDL